MRNGTFNTSKCRGKLQKMEVLYIHFPKSSSPFPNLPKKKKKKRIVWPIQVSTCGRPWVDNPGSLTSGHQTAGDQWSGFGRLAVTRSWLLVTGNLVTNSCRPWVVGPGPPNNQRSPASCGSTPRQGSNCPFFFEIFFLLPSIFCASGELLLVGSRTCSPCPKFT
jgi:hypothetical protein